MIDPVEICRARGWPLVTASDQEMLDVKLSHRRTDDGRTWEEMPRD